MLIPTVLVVDEEPHVLSFLADALHIAGDTVLTASSGALGLTPGRNSCFIRVVSLHQADRPRYGETMVHPVVPTPCEPYR
jgi:hypothetical protein